MTDWDGTNEAKTMSEMAVTTTIPQLALILVQWVDKNWILSCTEKHCSHHYFKIMMETKKKRNLIFNIFLLAVGLQSVLES